MSKTENTAHKREHGTTKSYVIGFVLSLLFTIIPYYLVVEQSMSRTALLATIISFGVAQMIVQVLFFLHLGREKKPHWQAGFLVATVGAIIAVVVGSLWIMNHLHYNMTPVTPADASMKLIEDEGISQIGGEKTGACEGVHATHKVTIKNGDFSPSHVDAKICDKLTFINEDKDAHYIMFGSFEQPKAYGGEDMLTVTNRRAKTIVLNETGTHYFHDHMDKDKTGDFTVVE